MYFINYFVLISPIFLSKLVNSQTADINELVPGKLHKSVAHKGYARLSIYCYRGVPKSVKNFWQTVQLQIIIDSNNWESYIGPTSEDVLREYEEHRSSWSFNFPFSSKNSIYNLNPFNNSCIGIDTTQDHNALLHVIRFDLWRISLFLSGLVLFFHARRLSTNPIFHYSCGIALGVTTSFLILIYFTSKLFPTKPAVYGFLAGGWAISIYVIQLLLNNIKTIALVYQNYVLGYFGAVATLSFGVCYRYGPVKNVRTLALIRWSLQITGLFEVYLSSDFTEAAVAVIITAVLLSFVDYKILHWIFSKCGRKSQLNFDLIILVFFKARLRRARFPPKCKLLTEDEYNEQGVKETNKALQELREFCSSPECKHWRTVLRLKNPQRFASFIEGESHVSGDEASEYESEISKLGFVTDDDSN